MLCMETRNILGSLVNNSQGNIPNQNGLFPLNYHIIWNRK